MHQDKKPAALTLKNLTKKYGRARGISDVSLVVEQGEIFGFLGPNGAGKSTTINLILDTLRPTSGSISIFGLDAQKDATKAHARMGYVAGDLETDSSLTGKQYLTFAAHLRGGVEQSAIDELIARFKCDTSKTIRHLSRGNQQKISLISALMHDPDLLVLDEPTSGLDPLMQAEFNEILKERQARGKTTFLSSHILSEVQATCQRLGFIRDGKLIEVSTLEDLTAKAPQQVDVAFTDTVDIADIKDLPGADNVKQHGNLFSFTFAGDYSTLVSLLAEHTIASLQILEPDLEELFMNYYESQETHNV